MTKSIGSSAVLLTVVLLMWAGSVSARTGGTFVPTPGSAAQIKAVASAVNPSQMLTLSASSIYTGGGEGNHEDDKDRDIDKDHNTDHDRDHDRDHDKDHDRNHDKDHDDHSPTPEPSTILSFGAALLIGGGVLFSRRLRGTKK